MSTEHHELITVQEACRRLGIGRTTLNSLLSDHKLTRLKIGRRTLITCADLDRFISSLNGNAGGDQDA